MTTEVEGANRIFLGGVPYYLAEAQIKELLESFGPLRGFDLVKDKDIGNSRGYGFCIYDPQYVGTVIGEGLRFLRLRCPCQQNGVDCGYYVMRFMKEMSSHKHFQILELYFPDCQFPSYDKSQIDEVRTQWVRYVVQQM